MQTLIDATPIFDLGQVGNLDLLGTLRGTIVVPEAVANEITVEPAATNLDRFIDEFHVETDPDYADWLDDATHLLDEPEANSDVWLTAGLLRGRDLSDDTLFVSDDRRLRAVADGLGATVTGTFGVVVCASLEDKYFSPTKAKRVLRRTDHHGLQMTGRLRERAVGEVD